MSTYELQKLLESTGLSEKEAITYLTNLELGTTLASSIAKRTKINRCTTYNILDQLTERGLVNRLTKNKTQFYSAEDATKIIEYIEQKKQKIEESVRELRARMHEFEKIKRARKSNPRVKLLTGQKGIKETYEHIRSQGFKTRTIKIAQSSELVIFGNSIALVSRLEGMSVLIQSHEISKLHKEIFNNLPEKFTSEHRSLFDDALK